MPLAKCYKCLYQGQLFYVFAANTREAALVVYGGLLANDLDTVIIERCPELEGRAWEARRFTAYTLNENGGLSPIAL